MIALQYIWIFPGLSRCPVPIPRLTSSSSNVVCVCVRIHNKHIHTSFPPKNGQIISCLNESPTLKTSTIIHQLKTFTFTYACNSDKTPVTAPKKPQKCAYTYTIKTVTTR